MKKLKINILISIIYQCATIISGFILPRLLIAYFGSEVNGLTQSIKQFLGLISFLDLGIGQVIRSALYKPLAENNRSRISQIMVSGGKFYRTLAYILLVYIMVLVVAYPMVVIQSFTWIFVVTLLLAISIGSFAQYYFGIINEQLLHADQKSYLIYSVHIVCTVTNLILCVLLINIGAPIQLVMLTTAIVFLAKPVFYSLYIRKKYCINKNISYEKDAIPQRWSAIAQHVAAVVLDGTDNVVLTLFASLTDVSIYSVYYMIVGSLQGFYQTVAVSIQSAAGALWAEGDFNKIKKMFSSAEFGLHSATLFVFTCAGILIVPFVQVYTKGVGDANYSQPIFAFILVLAYGIRCLRTPYNIWILAAVHFKQTQRCHIIAAALNLVISVLVVSKWGLIGVAIGTFIAMCYQTVWLTVYATKHLINCSAKHIIKRYIADIVSVVVIAAITSMFSMHEITYFGWIILAIKVAVVSLVCIAVVSLLFCREDFAEAFRSLFNKIIPRK